MPTMANLRLFCNIVAILTIFAVSKANCDAITLEVIHGEHDRLPDGYCIEAIVIEINPAKDIITHEIGERTELTLNLQVPGVYSFYAQSIICEIGSGCEFEGDGLGIIEISADSEPIDYIVGDPKAPDENPPPAIPPDDPGTYSGSSGGCFVDLIGQKNNE